MKRVQFRDLVGGNLADTNIIPIKDLDCSYKHDSGTETARRGNKDISVQNSKKRKLIEGKTGMFVVKRPNSLMMMKENRRKLPMPAPPTLTSTLNDDRDYFHDIVIPELSYQPKPSTSSSSSSSLTSSSSWPSKEVFEDSNPRNGFGDSNGHSQDRNEHHENRSAQMGYHNHQRIGIHENENDRQEGYPPGNSSEVFSPHLPDGSIHVSYTSSNAKSFNDFQAITAIEEMSPFQSHEKEVSLSSNKKHAAEDFTEKQIATQKQESSVVANSLLTEDWNCIHCSHLNYGGKFCSTCGVPKPNEEVPLKVNMGYDPLASSRDQGDDRRPCEISCRYEAQRDGCKGKLSSRNPCQYLHMGDPKFDIEDAELKLEEWYDKLDKQTQERIVCMLREQPDGLTKRAIYRLYKQKYKEEVYVPRKYRNFEGFILDDDRVKYDWFVNIRENVYSCKRGY